MNDPTSVPPARPRLTARPYAWRDKDRTETPGIAIWHRKGLAGHLTYSEARALADRLHDLADAAGSGTKSHSN